MNVDLKFIHLPFIFNIYKKIKQNKSNKIIQFKKKQVEGGKIKTISNLTEKLFPTVSCAT